MRKSLPFFAIITLITATLMANCVLEFPNADIYYPEGYEEVAVNVGNTFESIRSKAIELIGNDPGRINIVLADFGANTNGLAQPHNHKTIQIFVWPADTMLSTRMNESNHYRLLLMHEFTHIAHLTYTTGFPAFVSRVIFGTEMLSPQQLSPFVEGVTLFAESSNFFSEGRLNNPMWGREMTYQNSKSNSFPGLDYALSVSGEDYRGGALYYNYLATFYDYLVKRFGIESVKQFHKEVSGRLPIIGPINASRIAFGETLDNLYLDWKEETELRATKYATLTEVRTIENGQIYDIAKTANGVIFSYSIFGEATSWNGSVERGIEEYVDGGFSRRLSDFGALTLKWHEGNIYLMTSVTERNTTSREIWSHKLPLSVRLLDKGMITAFEIYNGRLIKAVYDAKTEISTIFFDEMQLIRIPWVVKDMLILEDGSLIMMLSSSGINGAIATFKEGEFRVILDDPYLKGRGIDYYEGKVVFTAAYEEGFMDAFAVDLESLQISRLTHGANLEKAVVLDSKVYGFGHSRREKGMSVFAFDFESTPYVVTAVESDDFEPLQVEYTVGDYLKKSFLHFLNPVLRAPLVSYDGENISLGLLTVHLSHDSKHSMELKPLFTFGTNKLSFQGEYTGQFLEGVNVSLKVNLGTPNVPVATAGLSSELFQMPLNPSTRFRSYAHIGFDTSGGMTTSVPLSLKGNLFAISLEPGIKLSDGEITPLLSLDAGFAPTLGTSINLGVGFFDDFYWYANGAQLLYRIDWGWSPMFFLKEIGIGVEVSGTNTSLDHSALYMFVNVGSTLGLGDVFPKIGIQHSDSGFGFYFELDAKP